MSMGETALKEEEKRRARGARPDMRDKVYVGLIDMRAAYDRVDRTVLMKMMELSTIGKEVTTAVAKIMRSTSFSIPVEQNQKRERKDTNAAKRYKVVKTDIGVQQGSVVSPSLFSLYLASLLKKLEPVTGASMAWADDLAFTCTSREKLR